MTEEQHEHPHMVLQHVIQRVDIHRESVHDSTNRRRVKEGHRSVEDGLQHRPMHVGAGADVAIRKAHQANKQHQTCIIIIITVGF